MIHVAALWSTEAKNVSRCFDNSRSNLFPGVFKLFLLRVFANESRRGIVSQAQQANPPVDPTVIAYMQNPTT